MIAQLTKWIRHYSVILGLIAGIVEIIVIIIGLAQLIPVWLLFSLLIVIPLGIFCIWQHIRIIELKDLQHDKLILKRTHVVKFLPKVTDGFLAATRQSTYLMKANTPIDTWAFSINRRGDDDPPYIVSEARRKPEAIVSRSGKGLCSVGDYHKTINSLSYRIDFEPDLRVSETCEVNHVYAIENYMSADLQTLRKRPRMASPTIGNCEMVSFSISNPTQEFTAEVWIPMVLETKKHHFEVGGRRTFHAKETAIISEQNLFNVLPTSYDGQEYWVMRIERLNPPVGVTYKLCWMPPEASTTAK
jgi:hypothetical protein